MTKGVFYAALALTLVYATVGMSHADSEARVGEEDDPKVWPCITKDARPWTRWWWMGSAVDKENLSRELASYRQAGLGGVEITPIYGVKGRESEFIEYLNPRWMEMMQFSVTTAASLGLGVDMANGTGWCFGGPNVAPDDANAAVKCRTTEVQAGERPSGKYDPKTDQAIIAYPTGGKKPLELSSWVDAGGNVDWTAPESGAPWTVYAISQKPSGVMVKRPALGGAGPMLNLLYPAAMGRYLQRFDDAFAIAGKDAPMPAAMFHDSYEYKSDWAPNFLAEFEKRRGYKLEYELPALFGKELSDHVARVKSDYRETISDVMAEETIPLWTHWAHEHGFITREQAHGSPGNWLDLYGAADIPETEMFDQDRDILVSKFASSAAHVTGKNLVGAETGTWAAEHFCEKLSDLKTIVDELFLSGVNRITFHGTAYSPTDAAWPGWCFYASTELNSRNALWRDLSALNAYITRVQSVLQSGRPDNDVLLYWPIYDRWHDASGLVQSFTIHARDWLHDQPVGKVADLLHHSGVQFDYVSDRQLTETTVQNGSIFRRNNRYKLIVVPRCEHIPVETFERLGALISEGAEVIFCDSVPDDVPGTYQIQERRDQLKQAKLKAEKTTGKRDHAFRCSSDLSKEIETNFTTSDAISIPCEPMVSEAGLQVVRRTAAGGNYFFAVNTSGKRIDGWVSLHDDNVKGVAIMDPISGRSGMADFNHEGEVEHNPSPRPKVYLQLEPLQSVILRTFHEREKFEKIPSWKYWDPSGRPIEILGAWKVEFTEGGPALPSPTTIESLSSWTNFGGESAQSFAGTARYTIHFDAPTPGAPHYSLDLGDVRSSARVRLNGNDLGTLFTNPFQVAVDTLETKNNVLEIEVTGTSANRIRDLDLKKTRWKIFYDANIVTKDYQPFDAAKWPISEQGLLGPVVLQPETDRTPRSTK